MHAEYRQQLLNRWKSIEGHVRAVRRMIEEDRCCVDILKQSLAVQGAVEKANALLLENHMNTCVITAIRGDAQGERERVIGELLQLFRGGMRVASNRQVNCEGGGNDENHREPVVTISER